MPGRRISTRCFSLKNIEKQVAGQINFKENFDFRIKNIWQIKY